MKKLLISLAVLLITAVSAQAGPEEDRMAFIKYYKGKFPNVPMEEYANGAYAIDPVGRENWEAIEEFPPTSLSLIVDK